MDRVLKLLAEMGQALRGLDARVAHLEALEYPSEGGGGGAWELVDEEVLTGSAASISFSSLPATYRALVLMTQLRTDYESEYDYALARFNGDSDANYDQLRHYSNESNWGMTETDRAQTSIRAVYTEGDSSRASSFAVGLIWLVGYALTDREKYLFTNGSARFGNVSNDNDVYIAEHRGRWRSTAAINAVALLPENGGNFVSGSRVAVYGVT